MFQTLEMCSFAVHFHKVSFEISVLWLNGHISFSHRRQSTKQHQSILEVYQTPVIFCLKVAFHSIKEDAGWEVFHSLRSLLPNLTTFSPIHVEIRKLQHIYSMDAFFNRCAFCAEEVGIRFPGNHCSYMIEVSTQTLTPESDLTSWNSILDMQTRWPFTVGEQCQAPLIGRSKCPQTNFQPYSHHRVWLALELISSAFH